MAPVILGISRADLDANRIHLHFEEGRRLDLCEALLRWWSERKKGRGPLALDAIVLRHIDGLYLDFAMAGLVYRLYRGIWGNKPLQRALGQLPERRQYAPHLQEIWDRVAKHEETVEDWGEVSRYFKALVLRLRESGYLTGEPPLTHQIEYFGQH